MHDSFNGYTVVFAPHLEFFNDAPEFGGMTGQFRAAMRR